MNARPLPVRRRTGLRRGGFSLVEMMVALGIGMVLVVTITSVYLNSRTAFRRQDQLKDIQQSVRMAFEYLTVDARAAGLRGCQTGRENPSFTSLSTGFTTNFAMGIEGYDASDAPSYPLTDINTPANWATNDSTGASVGAVPLATLNTSGRITKGSDVLVLRTASPSVRLTASTSTGAAFVDIEAEAPTSSDKCADNTTARLGGFCSSSYGMISSCTTSRVFQVGTATANGTNRARLSFAAGTTLGSEPIYSADTAEVFPLQTVAYYVRAASGGTGTSLYRHVYDGNGDSEQELIEGVESMQIRYGVDTSTPDADGVVDAYVDANATNLGDWSRVGAVRISLLIRSLDPVSPDLKLPPTANVNGVTVTFPTTGPLYDRRVFTTTIALRNKASY